MNPPAGTLFRLILLACSSIPGGAGTASAGTPAFVSSRIPVPARAHRLAAADLDGDGDRDLVVLSLARLQSDLTVLRNTGGMTFTASWSAVLPPATGPANPDLDLADLDLDGDVDLVLSVPGALSQVRLNGGPANPATFDVAVALAVAGQHVQSALGLLDGDLVPDLVTYSLDPGGEIIGRKGVGDGTFLAASAALVGNDSPLARIELGDVTGDGVLDLVRASGFGVETLAGQSGAGFPGWGTSTLHWFDPCDDLAVADLENDTWADLVVTIPGSGAIEVFHGLPGGGVSGPAPYPGGLTPRALTTGDLDRDGLREVVVGSGSSDTITILPGQPGGIYLDSPVTIPDARGVSDLIAADLDGDGDLDLAATLLGGDVLLLENQLVP